MGFRVEDGVAHDASSGRATIADLAEVYEQGYRRFLRVAEAIVVDPELARDVVQEAFARAIRSRFDYRGVGSLEGWVWRTVVNTAKTAARDRPLDQLPLHQLPAEPVATNGAKPQHDLRETLLALPERQRLVVFLRYYADLDYRAIGEALEIRSGTVGATLNQAHVALRSVLEEVRR
jgi:RNA polymerase sigma factor (sigma-70 family)